MNNVASQQAMVLHPAGLNVTVPGDLLRFDILVNVSSDVNPGAADVLALKVTPVAFQDVWLACMSCNCCRHEPCAEVGAPHATGPGAAGTHQLDAV